MATSERSDWTERFARLRLVSPGKIDDLTLRRALCGDGRSTDGVSVLADDDHRFIRCATARDDEVLAIGFERAALVDCIAGSVEPPTRSSVLGTDAGGIGGHVG